MRKVIWKYELMPSYETVEALDGAIGADRTMYRTIALPFDAHIIGRVRVDPLALSDARAAHDVAAVVGWFAVNPDPKTPTEVHRITLAFTGAPWPEHKHVGTVVVCQHRPRVVHVFLSGGGA